MSEEALVHFQVRTDNHIENYQELLDRIRAEVEGALDPRFTDRIWRVEVYFQYMNSHKRGVDTRCCIEVSLAGHQPVAVDDRAADIDEAVSGAVDKLLRALDRTLGRLDDRDDRVSMSGEQT
jgi:ribosome-associated translation inhibitor RaiA